MSEATRRLSTFGSIELGLLQLGLALLCAYFTMGLLAPHAYAWPLLMGPGPFFPLLCAYLCVQLPRRTPHLYRMLCFTTLYSVPYAGIALVRGHDVSGHALQLGDIPPLLLAVTLAVRVRAWRRLFDAPAAGPDVGRSVLVELFAGVGAWSLMLCGVSFLKPVQDWARGTAAPGELIASAAYAVALLRLMFVPALVAAFIGWGLFRGRAGPHWMSAALVYVASMAVVHVSLVAAFARDFWSRLAGASWTLVLLAFAARLYIGRRRMTPPHDAAAPQVF